MLTKVQKAAALAALVAVAAPFAGVKVNVFTNAITPADTNVLGDYTQATYTGHALSAAIVWGTPYINTAGDGEVLGQMLTFQPSDGATPNTITGALMTDGAGAVLIGADRFPADVPLPDQFAALHVVPALIMGDDGFTLEFRQVA